MIIRAVSDSPPSATANPAAQTGSMAMITAARLASRWAWAQVCSQHGQRPGGHREVDQDQPVRGLPGSVIPAGWPAAGSTAARAQTAVMVTIWTSDRVSAVAAVLILPRATMCAA